MGLLDHAADYELWLKQRDRRALRLMIVAVLLSFAIAYVLFMLPQPKSALVQFLSKVSPSVGPLAVLIVYLRMLSQSAPHPFELRIGESNTAELIRLRLALLGRAKSRATKELWWRSAAFGDIQARAYLSGGDWEVLATGPAISHGQMQAARLPSVLDSYPNWARWAWRPFTVSGSVFLLTLLFYGADTINSFATGRNSNNELLATVMTYSLCIAGGFGVVLALGNQVRESRLARMPTERLIQAWLEGNIDAVSYLKRRAKTDGEANALAERCGWK